jgi:hypothetical protein
MIDDLIKVIELSPARQSQTFYRVDISKNNNTVTIILEPTLDFFLKQRTGESDPYQLYTSALFHAGLTIGCIETWCKKNNKIYNINENILPFEFSKSPNSVSLIDMHRNLIIEEAAAFIEHQRINNIKFKDYQYDQSKCRRDIDFLLSSLINDISYNTTENSIALAYKFFNGNGECVVRRSMEIEVHYYLKNLIKNFILPKIKYTKFFQKIHNQIFPNIIAERSSSSTLDTSYSILIKALDKGIFSIPASLNKTPRNKDKIEVTIYE